jgi:hypothetical protein
MMSLRPRVTRSWVDANTTIKRTMFTRPPVGRRRGEFPWSIPSRSEALYLSAPRPAPYLGPEWRTRRDPKSTTTCRLGRRFRRIRRCSMGRLLRIIPRRDTGRTRTFSRLSVSQKAKRLPSSFSSLRFLGHVYTRELVFTVSKF